MRRVASARKRTENDTMVYWNTPFKTYITYIPEVDVSQLQPNALVMANHLRAVVEVVPVVAGANPVVVGSCVVGLVVGVGRLVKVLTSRGILGGGSGVEAGGGLSVKGREHFVLRCKHCIMKVPCGCFEHTVASTQRPAPLCSLPRTAPQPPPATQRA